jgi:hypothetical protein
VFGIFLLICAGPGLSLGTGMDGGSDGDGLGGGRALTGSAGLDLFYSNLALDTYDWDPATETFSSA